VLHNFVLNWPGPDGGLVLHQHSSVVDPALGSSVVVWCALNDASEDLAAVGRIEALDIIDGTDVAVVSIELGEVSE
jgi:hypothetical protein